MRASVVSASMFVGCTLSVVACGEASPEAKAPLAARVTGAFIDREERAGKGASDHAPVIVDLAD